MLGIFIAMDKEAALLRKKTALLSKKEWGDASFELRQGPKIKPFVLIVSGIGKTRVALSLGALSGLYPQVDAVLSAGVSASLSDELPPFTPFYPTRFVNHDIDTTPFGDPKGLFYGTDIVYFEAAPKLHASLLESAPEDAVKEGVEAAGDRFVASEGDAQRIHGEFGALAVDMETGSLAASCHLAKLPFAAIRVVSDPASKDDYERNFGRAAAVLTDAVMSALNRLE